MLLAVLLFAVQVQVPTRIMVAFGTRPEAIKLAPVVRELRAAPDTWSVQVVHVGQHRDLLSPAFMRTLDSAFGFRTDMTLDVMEHNQSLADLGARVLARMSGVLRREREAARAPRLMLVQGDTTTALMSAMAAFYDGVGVAHLEAGLRTFDMSRPFPEEAHRHLIAALAQYHFSPTDACRRNLLHEGVDAAAICLSGNTVIDALLRVVALPPPEEAQTLLERVLPGRDEQMPTPRLLLVTAHRRENHPHMARLCEAIRTLVRRNPEVRVLWPLHPNPNVRSVVRASLADVDRVYLVEPLGYAAFAHVLAAAYIVLSDSGGIQEEAPALGVPVLVLRDRSSRMEGVRTGSAALVGTRPDVVVPAAEKLLRNASAYAAAGGKQLPYGDGQAARRLVAWLRQRVADEDPDSAAPQSDANGGRWPRGSAAPRAARPQPHATCTA